MPVKNEITSFTVSTNLQSAAISRNRGEIATVQFGTTGWDSSNVTFSVVERTPENNVLLLFSNGSVDERSESQLTEPRVFGPLALNWLIGTTLNYTGFTHEKSGNTWTTTIQSGVLSFQGSDNNEANALAKAITAYLNGGGAIK